MGVINSIITMLEARFHEIWRNYRESPLETYKHCVSVLSCVYTLRLIWPISYPGECDLMVHTRKHSVNSLPMRLVIFVRI